MQGGERPGLVVHVRRGRNGLRDSAGWLGCGRQVTSIACALYSYLFRPRAACFSAASVPSRLAPKPGFHQTIKHCCSASSSSWLLCSRFVWSFSLLGVDFFTFLLAPLSSMNRAVDPFVEAVSKKGVVFCERGCPPIICSLFRRRAILSYIQQ